MLNTYLNYIKENPQGYWFKAKWFGWGWTPVKWQGWAVTLAYITIITLLSGSVSENASVRDMLFPFIVPSVILTVVFVFIAYKKGEKPRWRWGFPKNK